MKQTVHYRQLRVHQLADIDGNIQALNQESASRGEHGHWACSRVVDLGKDGHLATYLYLPLHHELLAAAMKQPETP